MTTRATLKELADMTGKKSPNIIKTLRANGLKADRNKQYDKAKALTAILEGQSLDKSKTEREIQKMQAAGVDEHSIVYKQKLAAYRRAVLQGDILETQRDEARKLLADRADVKNYWVRIYSDMITRIKTWKESETAKRPKLRVPIAGVSDGLIACMKDVLESHK